MRGNTMKIRLIITGFLITIFFLACNSNAEINNRVVVTVNNDIITLYELNNRIKELTGQTSEMLKSQDEEKFIETRRQILETMIDEKIAQSKIEELKLKVSEDAIDSYIENIKKANNLTQEDLEAGIKDEGITLDAYRKSIREKLERNDLIEYEVKQKAVILESQVLKYYQDHTDEFKEEETDKIASIVLKIQDENNKEQINELTLKGEKILARVKAGEDFGALAKEFSQGPGADEGGVLGDFSASVIDPALKKVLDTLDDGEVSGLITTKGAIQIIKLVKRTGGDVKSFAKVRDEIYETIYNKELEKRYSSFIKELRDKSFIKINF
jgi:peptidyl-prolyl cis-trans isomerase SurA